MKVANIHQYYSVGSSSLVQPKTVQVYFSLMDYLTLQLEGDLEQRQIGGVITTHLETLVVPLLDGGK